MYKSQKNHFLVSIIIPSFNRAYCLGRAIQSVIHQSYQNWELIIVDNHSSDNTDEVVKEFCDPRIQLIKIHNQGVIAVSRNTGLKVAKGDYVAFLDSDDWWMPEKLKVSVERLEAGGDIVYHDLFLVSSWPIKSTPRNIAKTRKLNMNSFEDLLANGNALVTSGVVLRSQLMRLIGGFSEDPLLVAVEDFDAWLRLAQCTNAFVQIEDCLGYYWGDGGVSSSPNITLTNLARLRQLYESELQHVSLDIIPGWMSYSLARAYFLTRQFKKTREYTVLAIKTNHQPLIKFKCFFMFCIACFHIFDQK